MDNHAKSRVIIQGLAIKAIAKPAFNDGELAAAAFAMVTFLSEVDPEFNPPEFLAVLEAVIGRPCGVTVTRVDAPTDTKSAETVH
jgi:hypothetical protein